MVDLRRRNKVKAVRVQSIDGSGRVRELEQEKDASPGCRRGQCIIFALLVLSLVFFFGWIIMTGWREDVNSHFKLICINLERRQDRRWKFIQQMQLAGVDMHQYEFLAATDGQELVRNEELDMFEENTFGWRRGMVGCAMSHLRIWKKLLADPVPEFYVVFEDDVTFAPEFRLKLETVLHALIYTIDDWDVVWLGYSMWSYDLANAPQYRAKETDQLAVQDLDLSKAIGGAFAYAIHKRAAQKFVDYIDVHGFKYAVDELMMGAQNKHNLGLDLTVSRLEVVPHIVLTNWTEPTDGIWKHVDSDIQKDFYAVPFPEV